MDRKNSIVFTAKRVGNIEIKNRIVKSATFENAATTDGEVTDTLIKIYSDLAKGGAGMIITGGAAVYPKNISLHRAMRVYDDRYIPGLNRLTKAVHEADGDCKIILQLFHQGRQVTTAESGAHLGAYLSPALMDYIGSHPEIFDEEGGDDEAEPTGPSSVFDTLLQQTPRALTVEEIEAIVNGFADGILRAREAGFDGVQLHAAHGWLLSSFLSARTNKRDDQYGGSIENRIRIIQEIYEKGRKKVGENFPVMIKMDTTDFFPDGTTIGQSVETAKCISTLGIDAVEASGGMWESLTLGEEKLGWKPYLIPEARVDIDTRDKEGYFLEGAKAIKKQITPPVMLVGGVRSFSKAEEILGQGDVDFVSLARPLIRQPDLPRIWLAGGPDKAGCISCNACFPVGNPPLSCKLDS